MSEGFYLTREQATEFKAMLKAWPLVMDIVNRVQRLEGPGITNGPGGLSIKLPPAPKKSSRPGTGGGGGGSTPTIFPAIITGASQDGSNKRWSYTFEKAAKTAAGYAGFGAATGDDALSGTARNLIEYNNGATGAFGNGTNSGNFLGTFAIQRVPDDTPVFIHEVPTLIDGTPGTEYWFSYENGVDGDCPA